MGATLTFYVYHCYALILNSGGVALLNHEQLNMNDRFGQVMMDNLSQRGFGLPGVSSCRGKLLTN